jgi:fluoride exporter
MTTALMVIVGGAVGAPARYLIGMWVGSRVRHHRFGSLPWGTLTVNLLGSLILGLVAALTAGGAPDWLLTTVGTGFCGALTTFSTFGIESVNLAEEGRLEAAAATVAMSLLLGLLACVAGWQLGSLLG